MVVEGGALIIVGAGGTVTMAVGAVGAVGAAGAAAAGAAGRAGAAAERAGAAGAGAGRAGAEAWRVGADGAGAAGAAGAERVAGWVAGWLAVVGWDGMMTVCSGFWMGEVTMLAVGLAIGLGDAVGGRVTMVVGWRLAPRGN